MRYFLAIALAFVLLGCGPVVDESPITLTEDELIYISKNPSITWAVEDNRPPYVFIEGNDVVQGLSLDYLQLISKKTGLVFVPVRTVDFSGSISAVKDGSVGVMTAIRPTPQWSEFMSFTPPVVYSAGIFLFRRNKLPRSPLTISIRRDDAAIAYIEDRFPDMRIIESVDDEESLALLQKGLIDGAVMDEITADYLSGLAIVYELKAQIEFDYPLSFAYKKEDRLLGSILTKAINAISVADKKVLNNRWIGANS